jgi:hypothetical protein
LVSIVAINTIKRSMLKRIKPRVILILRGIVIIAYT